MGIIHSIADLYCYVRRSEMYHMHPTRLRIFLGTKRVQTVLKWILIVIITGAFVYLAAR